MDSVEAITSAVFRVEVATSAEATDSEGASAAIVSVAAEATATGKGAQVSKRWPG